MAVRGTTDEPAETTLTPAARRVLEVASELFYWRGINAVGVDSIAAESGVTKRTLYDRFGSKDGLIVAYLRARDRRWRDLVTARLDDAAPADPAERVLVPFDVLAEWLGSNSRGCCFVNAFAELPRSDHPARRLINDEKRWLHDLFQHLLTEADIGPLQAGRLATQLLCLHEGAMVSFSAAAEPTAVAAARVAASALIEHARSTSMASRRRSSDQRRQRWQTTKRSTAT